LFVATFYLQFQVPRFASQFPIKHERAARLV